MKVAIFDFDGTILCGNSYHLFFRWMLRQHPARAAGLLGWLVLRRLRLISARTMKERVTALLAGRSRDAVADIGRKVYRSEIAPRLDVFALRELERHRREGREIIILTGAFDFLVRPFISQHEIRYWAATRLTFSGGVCTGRIDGAEVRGMAKRIVAESMAIQASVDWSASWAYGDEADDLPMLSLVGNPVFVGSKKIRLPDGIVSRGWRPVQSG